MLELDEQQQAAVTEAAKKIAILSSPDRTAMIRTRLPLALTPSVKTRPDQSLANI